MADKGQGSYIGDENSSDIEIEIDVEVLAKRLLEDEAFIERVSLKVRKAMTRDARRLGNLFGPWAGK